MIVYAWRSLATPGGGELGKPILAFKAPERIFLALVGTGAKYKRGGVAMGAPGPP